MEKERCFVSIVVYIRNSEKYIEEFMISLFEILDSNFHEYEIICVDDASNDQSVNIIKNLFAQKRGCTIRLITLGYFHGVEKAMNAGVDMTIGDMIFEFDCVLLNYEPKLILDVFHKTREGFDIVSASPRNIKRLGTNFYYALVKMFLKNVGPIQTETFRIISRRALNRVDDVNKSVPFRQILYSMCGLKKATMEYTPINKLKIKLEHRYRRELAIDTLMLFTNVGEKIAFVFSAFELLGATYLLYREGVNIETNLTFCMSGIFFLFGIVLKFLSIIKELIFTKHNYIVERIEEINTLNL